MSSNIQVGTRRDFPSKVLWDMHRLRTRVFKDRMGWEVPVLSGMEIDGYDATDPYYMVIRSSNGGVCGCWRMLPTEGPYMLKDTFPELLHGAPVKVFNAVVKPCNIPEANGFCLFFVSPAWHSDSFIDFRYVCVFPTGLRAPCQIHCLKPRRIFVPQGAKCCKPY